MAERTSNSPMDLGLLDVLIERLDRADLSHEQQLLVLAAFEGNVPLEQIVARFVDMQSSTESVSPMRGEPPTPFSGRCGSLHHFRPESGDTTQPSAGCARRPGGSVCRLFGSERG